MQIDILLIASQFYVQWPLLNAFRNVALVNIPFRNPSEISKYFVAKRQNDTAIYDIYNNKRLCNCVGVTSLKYLTNINSMTQNTKKSILN